MRIGADYYPEHWPRDRWETDAKLMNEAGFTITRLAEFSWVKLEPEEGKYDFAWLDEALDTLGKQGVMSILCTPTATMPKWLYDKYPEVNARDRDGHKAHFGNRQNNCFSSKVYRYFSRKITTALAERYAKHPYVVGWQLDNELHNPICFCDNCENAFRAYLKDKFKTIDALNEAYGTIFWSQCYGSFDEAHLPRHSNSSPSLYLDHQRFHSDLVVSFAREQVEILRRLCPNHFITHNFMGFAPDVDYYKLGELLDFVSHDYYYANDWDGRFDEIIFQTAALDLMRGCKAKNFHIMETNGGPGGWENYGRNLRPGELRRMSLKNMAHGADSHMWFRWRTCRYGTEQYWHGLLGHDGVPARRYAEAKQTTADMRKVWTELEGSVTKSEAAIVYDFNDRWALTQQSNNAGFDYVRAMLPYYRALYKRGINTDFINEETALDNYKLLLLPYKYIVTREYAQKIEAFVKKGGILILTCRCGVKDRNNVPHAMTLPGYFREVAGIRVEEYETIASAKPYKVEMDGGTYHGKLLADWIIPEKAETLAKFADGDTGYPVVTKNSFGGGLAYYVGTVPCKCLADKIISAAASDLRQFNLPEHAEAAVRVKDGAEFVFYINHTPEPRAFEAEGFDLLTGRECKGKLELEPNGAAVIRRKK
ncbi:MAG: beta-galactosidase [Treponema sp.]|jgi:beta-galactosidase|nr:beta-galactosidase [Treponema sp.]